MIKDVLNTYDKVYQIKIDMPGAGFGAVLLVTMNQLRYCDRNNFYPVVCYDETCENSFYDKDYGNDLWAQYFEPVMPFSIEKLKEELEKSKRSKDLLKLSSEQAIKLSEESPDSIYSYPFGKWRYEKRENTETWYEEQRAKGRETIRKYIKLKGHIQEKVDSFYHKHLTGAFVLGLHVRGTDLHYAPAVAPAEYFVHVDDYLQKHPDLKIFLATDQSQYVDIFSLRYGNRLFYTKCFRSDNEVAPFNRTEVSPYQKGEDVLLDMLLLSRTDFIIKGSSNVGEMALYFNEDLECLDLALNKTKAFGQDYGENWDNISNLPAWKLINKSALNKVPRDSSSQSLKQKLVFHFRKKLSHSMQMLGRFKKKIL